jgi:hypothetical protein
MGVERNLISAQLLSIRANSLSEQGLDLDLSEEIYAALEAWRQRMGRPICDLAEDLNVQGCPCPFRPAEDFVGLHAPVLHSDP